MGLKKTKRDDSPADSEKEKSGNEEGGESADVIYEVAKILGTKVYRRKRSFFVSWKGYPESSNTWEPEENLGGAREMIKDFMEEYEKTQVKRSGRKRNNTFSDSRAQSSTPSSTQNYRQISGKEEEEQSEDNGDEEPAVKKQRSVASVRATPVFAKVKGSNEPMLRNLIYLGDGTNEDTAVDEDDEKSDETEGKAKSVTPPKFPDTNNDTLEATSPFTLKLESEDRESGTKAKMSKQAQATMEESPSVDKATSSTRQELKFVGFECVKNSGELSFVVEESKKKHKTYSLEEAIKVDARGLARFTADKLNQIYKIFE